MRQCVLPAIVGPAEIAHRSTNSTEKTGPTLAIWMMAIFGFPPRRRKLKGNKGVRINSPALTITSPNPPDPSADATREPGTPWTLHLERAGQRADMVFRWIPPTTAERECWLGSRNGEPHEQPVHRVSLDGFWILETPATQLQYRLVMAERNLREQRANPSDFSGPEHPNADQHPVERVNWQNSRAFCLRIHEALAEETRPHPGGAFVLPTEAEWEYACRAGTRTEYWSGDGEAALAEVGWYEGNSGDKTHPVKEKDRPNPWGLHDLHGNVFEWCFDAWGGTWGSENYAYKKVADLANEHPHQRKDLKGIYHVARGGSWYDTATNCRSASRGRGDHSEADFIKGFRPAWRTQSGSSRSRPGRQKFC